MEPQRNEKPISVGEWVLNIFITAIPLIGFIMLIVWAVSKEIPESKSNWAKGMLIWYAIGIVLTILFGASVLAFIAASGDLNGY
ncbi:hypothetical protein [uncultured Roseivirga sp.]|uniref:hypothetical protein n=1 Tax=uncultured Roseivirga sp. TaxID=543088 RepID=UPI0030DC61FD|tara:strand:- start:355195 stop:355446 length:252 start_codon:yes stop_codon:yes gene_type:complete